MKKAKVGDAFIQVFTGSNHRFPTVFFITCVDDSKNLITQYVINRDGNVSVVSDAKVNVEHFYYHKSDFSKVYKL